jgi:hypothetical protein
MQMEVGGVGLRVVNVINPKTLQLTIGRISANNQAPTDAGCESKNFAGCEGEATWAKETKNFWHIKSKQRVLLYECNTTQAHKHKHTNTCTQATNHDGGPVQHHIHNQPRANAAWLTAGRRMQRR